MSTPSPLIPQGSLLEQQAKGKPHLRNAILIVAAHVVFLGGLLIAGCKREETPTAGATDGALPPLTGDPATRPIDSGLQATSQVPSQVGIAPADGAVTGLQPQQPSLAGQQQQQTLTPVITAPPAQEPVAATRDHVVTKGESFSSIGRKYGVTAAAIARANPGVDSTRLKIGDKLVIPAPSAPPAASSGQVVSHSDSAGGTYKVKSGDTLDRIARAHGTTVKELKAVNGLKTDRINVGQNLKLPAGRNSPAQTAGLPEPAPAPLPATLGAPDAPAGTGGATPTNPR